MARIVCALLLIVSSAAPAVSGPANVESVEVVDTGGGTYRFRVIVRHADEGWGHYADRWEVVSPDGEVLATRTLYHPHVDEQPFSRELSGVVIPTPIREVNVRAHDSVHGFAGAAQAVRLPGR